jgi:O-antigen/teichoic acid export membrane protein
VAHKTAKVFVILVLPIILGMLFLAPDIIRIVSGSGFEDSARVLQILAFSLAGIFFGHYFNMLILVGNIQKKLMFLLLGVAAVNITMNLTLIELLAYKGAAIASAVTEFLVVLISGWLVAKKIGFIPRPDRLLSIFMAALAMGMTLVLLTPGPFLVAGIASAMVYAGSLWIFRAITPEEIASVFSSKEEVSLQERITV